MKTDLLKLLINTMNNLPENVELDMATYGPHTCNTYACICGWGAQDKKVVKYIDLTVVSGGAVHGRLMYELGPDLAASVAGAVYTHRQLKATMVFGPKHPLTKHPHVTTPSSIADAKDYMTKLLAEIGTL